MSKLKIGWSEISITPDKRASLAGQLTKRMSEYVEKPITATAMAVEANGEQMVLVSADLLAIGSNVVDAVREKLANNSVGLEPMKVVLAAIHTHTAPLYPRVNRTSAAGGVTNSRAMLEQALPAGRKYVEKVSAKDDPSVITQQEVLEMLIDRLSKVVLDAWNNRAPGAYSNAFGRAVVGLCRRTSYSGHRPCRSFHRSKGSRTLGILLLH